MQRNQTLLIIGKVWPEPASSAAGSRMMQLIRLFQNDGWEITFVSAAAESEHAADLKSKGIGTASIQLNNSSFDRFIQKLTPGAVVFDRFMTEEQFGWRVAEYCPGALRILDTEDLHCLRTARQKAWKSGCEFKPELLLNEETAKREIASILRCDLSLIISEAEMDLLKNLFGIGEELIYYMPFLLDIKKTEEHPAYDERSGFISIGNFLHEPNWNAVIWLKEEIWPLIRKNMPDAELNIYGSYPSQKVFQLHQPDDGFFVKGRAEEALSVIRKARVLLAPLRFGAGLKGKLIEAMQCGTPSVTTSVGAEGMAGEMPWCGFIEDDAGSFAKAASRLCQNIDIWNSSREKGSEILKRRFRRESFEKSFLDRIKYLQSGLREHRMKNFIGSILMHHTTASTKYLSKWIEEKNRPDRK